MHARLPIALLTLVALAACGGGGGSSASSSAIPAPIATVPPATPAPASATLSGHVVALAGALSSTGVAPAPSSTLAPGAAIVGATVYITKLGGENVTALPTSPIATAITAADGSFAVTVPGNAGTLGVVVLNGTTIAAGTGTSDKGFTIAHGTATAGTPATFYVDTLTQDEQSAFAALNTKRAAVALPAIAADTIAQATARLTVAQQPGTATCDPYPGTGSAYRSFGGYSPTSGVLFWNDTAGPSWSAIVDYGSPWNNASATSAGLAAVYQRAPCGTGFSVPVNYFAGVYVL